MTNEEKIKIYTAWINGAKIETRRKNPAYFKEPWFITNTPQWAWDIYDYRVKKEPKDLYKYLIYNTATKQYCNTHNYYQYEKTAKEFLTEYQRIIQRLDHTKITIQE